MDPFYKVEVNKTVWEVPERYQMLSTVGCGAYGQVWYVLNAYACLLIFKVVNAGWQVPTVVAIPHVSLL